MGRTKSPCGVIGKGGVNPAPGAGDRLVRVAAEQLLTVPIDSLVPYANNARVHSKTQIAQLRASLREFGFVTPVLIDFDNNIIAGHGRVEAARAEGMTEVPCVLVSSLSEAQRKAYILADNRLSETGAWDPKLLELEIEGLKALHFDVGAAGFDLADTKARPVEAAPEETEEYKQFVEKFKPKLTTDDCCTPENIYQCVKNWGIQHYALEGAEVLRPFWPGGDYQSETYPEGCVVIDNPPFSILSEICRFYQDKGIRYFLFAPTLTLFSTAAGCCNYVLTGVSVTYANGAVVNTSFVTNLGNWKIETAPDLYQLVKAEDEKNRPEGSADLPEYVYPPEVLTPAASKLAKYGQTLRIRAEDTSFIRVLDRQRAKKKAIFGGGFLLSAYAAAERTAAECAAEHTEPMYTVTKWELSERERQLVQELGQGKK